MAKSISCWATFVLGMERVENSYGCGYYNQDEWLSYYLTLKMMAHAESSFKGVLLPIDEDML